MQMLYQLYLLQLALLYQLLLANRRTSHLCMDAEEIERLAPSNLTLLPAKLLHQRCTGGKKEKVTYLLFVYSCGSSHVPNEYQSAGTTRLYDGLPSGTHYYSNDHLGSSTLITDESGNEVIRTKYTPYGEIDLIHTGKYDPNTNTLTKNAETDPEYSVLGVRFTDQKYDPESSLYYYNARYYDPSIGVFTTADTIVPNTVEPKTKHDVFLNKSGLGSNRLLDLRKDHRLFMSKKLTQQSLKRVQESLLATSVLAFNRYMYVRGNPIIYTDPTGHIWGFFKKAWNGIKKVVSTIVTVVTAPVTIAVSAVQAAVTGQNFFKTVQSNIATVQNTVEKYVDEGLAIAAGIAATALTAGLASGILGAAIAGAFGGFAAGATHAALNGASLGGILVAGLIGGVAGFVGGVAGKFAFNKAGFAVKGLSKGLAKGFAGGTTKVFLEAATGRLNTGSLGGFFGNILGGAIWEGTSIPQDIGKFALDFYGPPPLGGLSGVP